MNTTTLQGRVCSPKSRPAETARFQRAATLLVAGTLAGTLSAGTFTTTFDSDPGSIVGTAVVEDGVLKLTTAEVNKKGSWSIPDIDNGAKVASFKATFKAKVGGGSARPAQGFSMVFSPDIGVDAFGEGGGTLQGLVISFDTTDNAAGFGAEGNLPGDAPGVIVKMGGARVIAKLASNLKTDDRFVDVTVQLDPDGTLDVIYDGVKIYDNVPIPYTPIAGAFGFGAATSDLTAALNANHFIDDLTITTTTVSGAYVSASSPSPVDALPQAVVKFSIEGGSAGTPALKFDGVTVTPVVSTAGGVTTVSYDPPGLLASGSQHTAGLTYGTAKSFILSFSVLNYPTIPASAALAAATVNTASSGFKVRTYQAAGFAVSSTANAERVLSGAAGDNIADLSGATGGVFNKDLINFDKDGNASGNIGGDELMPGIPGTLPDGNPATDNFALEILTYVDLPAGAQTLGVNSDDGFSVSVGPDARDATSTVLGSFPGTRAVGDTLFTFVAEKAGIYSLRLVYFDSTGGAGVELFSVDSDGNKTLINDRSTVGHVKAYRDRSASFKSPPYLSKASPAPGSTDVSTLPKIEAAITEDTTVVNAGSISMKVNGSAVTPGVNKTGKVTTLTYQTTSALAGQAPQAVEVGFSDNGGNTVARSWSFTTGKASAGGSSVKGYWRFQNGDLKATIGNDLTYIDPSVASEYKYGTTGAGEFVDVPGINGQPAKVLCIPYKSRADFDNLFQKLGLRMKHGISANGGGQNVNQWTMIVDLYWGDGTGNGTLLRTHDFDKAFDGDLFWAVGDEAYGKGCCSAYAGQDKSPGHSQPRNTWARVAFATDLAATPKLFGKFINGSKHAVAQAGGDAAALDSRFSLPPEIWLFNDGDDDEQSTAYVAAIQMREGKMSDEEVAALGGPSAEGIPVPTSGGVASSVKGQWDFDNGDLKATIGTDLAYIDPSVASEYKYGTTGAGEFVDVPGINGQPAKVLCIPYKSRADFDNLFQKLGLKMKHGISPNGGGQNVNQWTLIMDLYWGDGTGNGTVLRTHDFDKAFDGDLFWAVGDEAYGKGCCSAYAGQDKSPGHSQPRNTWARVAFAADLAATPKLFGKFINGSKHAVAQAGGDAAALDSRFSLPPEIWLFNDGDDDEQSTVYVNSIQVREGKMSDEEVAALGGPTAAPIPQPAVVSPSAVKGYWNFDNGDLKATIGTDLAYIDPSVASEYKYGTTGAGEFVDVPGIDGQPAKVLCIPYKSRADFDNLFQKLGLKMKHGIDPNGGGQNVNQWTLIMDLYWGDGTGNGTVLRTHDFDKAFDGDLFWAVGDEAYGKGCCSAYVGQDKGPGHSQPRNTWARVAFATDLAATPKLFGKFINGSKHAVAQAGGDAAALDSRFSLPPEIWLFNDGDDNEQSTVYVNSIQIREGKMSDEDVAALGGPSAGDIPGVTVVPAGIKNLKAGLVNGKVSITFDGLGTIQSSTTVGGSFTDTAIKSGDLLDITGGTQFLRAKK